MHLLQNGLRVLRCCAPLDMDTTIEIYCAPAFQGQQLNVRVNLIDQTDQSDRRVLQNIAGDDKAYYILFQDAARTIPLRDDMLEKIQDRNFRK
jgi:hypothetical protein